MSVLASAVITKARAITNDNGNRWDDPLCLNWINAGQKEIVVFKPNANPVIESVQLVSGVKQTLPPGGVQFGAIHRNMGANGTTPGTTINPLSLETLNSVLPEWNSVAPAAIVKYACHDERTPKTFYVSPPQPFSGQGYVELMYFKLPTDVVATSSAIFDDIYEMVLVDYLIYRCLQRDDPALAGGYYNAFLKALGAKTTNESSYKSAKS